MTTVTQTPDVTTAGTQAALPFFRGVGVVLSLELRQRIRGVGWYVLLGVFFSLVALVTLLLTLGLGPIAQDRGTTIFSVIVYLVLLLGTLVTPALSGNAINGDRDAGTLATIQVTLVTTAQLVLGKFLAAWASALVFLLAALPFLVIASVLGTPRFDTIAVSVLMLAAELGVVAAIGVGLSGILTRPLFSIVVTYLVVAALSIGTLIAFVLGGITTTTQVTRTYISVDYSGEIDPNTGMPLEVKCMPPETSSYPVGRFDLFWPLLALNPYVVVADAVPTAYTSQGGVVDMFGGIKLGIRSAQQAPELETVIDECAELQSDQSEMPPSPREQIESGTPGWFLGIALHVLLAAAALAGAWARTRTPARKLPKGSRIA